MSAADKKTRRRELTQRYGDVWIWGIYFVLLIISLVETYSASSQIAALGNVYKPLIEQCFFLSLSFGIVYLLGRQNYNNPVLLIGLVLLLWIATFAALAYVQVFGKVVNGAARAIYILGISIQPAEFAKLSTVTALAYVLARTQKRGGGVRNAGIIGAVVLIALLGWFMLRDGLTNTVLLMAISMIMMVVGGVEWRKIVIVFVAFGIIGAGYSEIKKYNDARDEVLRQEMIAKGIKVDEADENSPQSVDRSGMRQSRIHRWLHSDSLIYEPITSYNSQEMFSHMAMAHGGVTGVGIGHSRECSRLPLAFSDYVYSIIVEECGFVGGVVVLALFLCLLLRAAFIAQRCNRALPALLIMGAASMVTCQALCHIAINTGAMPVSGQPLPLISKGGSAILVNSIAFGIMICVSRSIANGVDRKQNKNINNKGDDASRAAAKLDEAPNPTQVFENEWK